MSYTLILYHIVFRTKNSARTIHIEHEEELYRYIWTFFKNRDCRLYRIGGMPDHIHILVQTPPTIKLSDLMRDLKTSANQYLKERCDLFPYFDGWGKGFCALSVSSADKERVISYIKGQKEHHTKVSFREEFMCILQEHGVEFDERYFSM